MRSRLTSLQKEVLDSFFRRESRFFLTGGAALAGFHTGHRETNDLDLFSTTTDPESGAEALAATARDLGASLEPLRTGPEFRRFLLKRGPEAVVVDLVREKSHQWVSEKPVLQGIRVDPPQEILANKLCALLSRGEIRDLVDVRELENTGYSFAEALAEASKKDAGLTPAQLGWVLSQVTIGDDASPPGGVSVPELREYLRNLVSRLARLAYPR